MNLRLTLKISLPTCVVGRQFCLRCRDVPDPSQAIYIYGDKLIIFYLLSAYKGQWSVTGIKELWIESFIWKLIQGGFILFEEY